MIPAGGLDDPLEVTSDDVEVAEEEEAVSNEAEGGIFTTAVDEAAAIPVGIVGGGNDATGDVTEEVGIPDAAATVPVCRGSW